MSWQQGMCCEPQRASGVVRINANPFPPSRFITTVMNFAVMPAAQRNGELIADFAAECGALRKAQMMGIGRVPATNKAWLPSNRFNVLPVANAARRRKREDAFIDNAGCAPIFHSRFGLMHRRFF